jgi:hypothetical protein
MSVLTFTTNDRFIFRIIKHYSTNPSRQWSNSYEVLANSTGSLGDLTVLGSALELFEATLHNTFTVFDRLVISTWVADSVPYDPDSFYVAELSGAGTRDTSGELEPITTCLSVARQPTSGRLGHIFYRGVLSQGDTSAPSGITVLNSPAALTSELNDALTDSELNGYLGLGAEGPLVLAMVNKSGTNTRIVNALKIAGVVQLPVDHAWFNRTTP